MNSELEHINRLLSKCEELRRWWVADGIDCGIVESLARSLSRSLSPGRMLAGDNALPQVAIPKLWNSLRLIGGVVPEEPREMQSEAAGVRALDTAVAWLNAQSAGQDRGETFPSYDRAALMDCSDLANKFAARPQSVFADVQLEYDLRVAGIREAEILRLKAAQQWPEAVRRKQGKPDPTRKWMHIPGDIKPGNFREGPIYASRAILGFAIQPLLRRIQKTDSAHLQYLKKHGEKNSGELMYVIECGERESLEVWFANRDRRFEVEGAISQDRQKRSEANKSDQKQKGIKQGSKSRCKR